MPPREAIRRVDRNRIEHVGTGGLEVFQALLGPRGVKGLVVDCEDCREPHYFAWALLRGNLRHLLDRGTARVHEPAFSPDPTDYVSPDSRSS